MEHKFYDLKRQYMYSYPHKAAYGFLDHINLDDYLPKLKRESGSLYIHIPFCVTKCGYCNLFSVTRADKQLVDAYMDTMNRQAETLGLRDIKFKELVIGGGTPLYLSEKNLESLFSMSGSVCQTVIETAPRQTVASKLDILKANHLNRISMGVQSFVDSELQTLSRNHKVKDITRALELLKSYDFPILNIDLIYGIPGQTIESLDYSLKQALEYEPEEIFAYPLYIKEGTAMAMEHKHISLQMDRLYDYLKEMLLSHGYVRESMRKFVRKESRKDVLSSKESSCGFDNTIALGCGGRSYIGNLHYCTPYHVGQEKCMAELKTYMEQRDFHTVCYGYLLNDDEMRRRYIIKNLLYYIGLDIKEFQEKFGESPFLIYPVLTDFQNEGYARIINNRLCLTDKGMDLSDIIGPKLISDTVREKMKNWSNN